jgi:hypothetical protein
MGTYHSNEACSDALTHLVSGASSESHRLPAYSRTSSVEDLSTVSAAALFESHLGAVDIGKVPLTESIDLVGLRNHRRGGGFNIAFRHLECCCRAVVRIAS